MAESFFAGLRSAFGGEPAPAGDKPFYEKGTDAYKEDLERRRGGLKSGRSQDRAEITALREQIKTGVMPDEAIDLYIHRNPGAAGEFNVARNFRDQQNKLQQMKEGRQEQLQGILRSAPIRGLEATPTVGVMAPGQAPVMHEAVPSRQEQLIRGGFLDEAERIGKVKGELGRIPETAKPAKKPTSIQEYELASTPEGGFKGSYYDFLKEKHQKAKNEINVNTGNKFGSELGKTAAKRLDTEFENASVAVNELMANNEAAAMLKNGVISGTAGDLRLGLARALATAGIGFGDEVERTDAYFASTAGLVASVIKAFGSGTGLSDKDREYAQKMAAGEISLTNASMKRILGIRRRASNVIIKRYNSFAGRSANAFPDSGVRELYPVLEIPQTKKDSANTGGIKFIGFE